MTATKKLTLAGVFFPHSNPKASAMSVSFGRCVGSANRAEAGSMLPTGRSRFTRT
ncbi:hypothetical protein D3C76_1816840 [compost metagenome]